MIVAVLDRWVGKIARLDLETGSITPWLARTLNAFPGCHPPNRKDRQQQLECGDPAE
jgi:hypothetical protein